MDARREREAAGVTEDFPLEEVGRPFAEAGLSDDDDDADEEEDQKPAAVATDEEEDVEK